VDRARWRTYDKGVQVVSRWFREGIRLDTGEIIEAHLGQQTLSDRRD
jgi:hypothetical protein